MYSKFILTIRNSNEVYNQNKRIALDVEGCNINGDLEELILSYVLFYIKPEYFIPILDIVDESHFFYPENKIVFLALKEALKSSHSFPKSSLLAFFRNG